MAEATHVLYFNGLGTGKTRKRERLAITYLAKRGIVVTHVSINWYADEPFDVILERAIQLTKEQLQTYDTLLLVGSSAGGSLAVNILGALRDPKLYAITLCSRLNEQPLAWWDRRSLTRMARLDSEHSSQAFFDSVTYCTETTIPGLADDTKQHIVTVQQWADFVVPRPTMTIPGARIYKVPGLGHGWGIATGTRRLPEIVRSLQRPLAPKYEIRPSTQ